MTIGMLHVTEKTIHINMKNLDFTRGFIAINQLFLELFKVLQILR